MKNKIFLPALAIFTVLVLSGCSLQSNKVNNQDDSNGEQKMNDISPTLAQTQPEETEKPAEEVIDTGVKVWNKMTDKCDQSVLNKNDLKSCLMNFDWSEVDDNTDANQMETAYIKYNGQEAGKGLFKVIMYKQWAADEDGNLYILEKLG